MTLRQQYQKCTSSHDDDDEEAQQSSATTSDIMPPSSMEGQPSAVIKLGEQQQQQHARQPKNRYYCPLFLESDVLNDHSDVPTSCSQGLKLKNNGRKSDIRSPTAGKQHKSMVRRRSRIRHPTFISLISTETAIEKIRLLFHRFATTVVPSSNTRSILLSLKRRRRKIAKTAADDEKIIIQRRRFHHLSSLELPFSSLLLWALTVLMITSAQCCVAAFSIRDVIRVSNNGAKRTVVAPRESRPEDRRTGTVVTGEKGDVTDSTDIVICPTWHPFQCPNGDCIPIKYLCDGSPDCSDEYDENKSMCTAAVRPPVEETAAFLRALLSAHGADFLVKLFGPKAKNELRPMGGVDKVAVAISQSPTVEAFATEMSLKPDETRQLANVLQSVLVAGATSELTPDEAGDFRFFVQKLQETGFF